MALIRITDDLFGAGIGINPNEFFVFAVIGG
jgi:hypothetical protein